ncbi:glycosyl hydrolase family 81-domain-containing protein [Podospora australis]|uniref:glucan endo-1,3-beta-D-glucosidase n=1 Tax=Podospora australis TaxID=1536484 RepID=A0AAN6WKJ0_9PEZI|nr:glycosyl hydrolase family 81-domain-containing protein [Podospora australis]
MSSHDSEDDLTTEEPPTIDPYEVLNLESRTATADQVKSAYRKAALKHHPDKAPADEQTAAKEKFQEIAFAYAILSDPARRKRYDETGSTSEAVVDSDGFSWTEFYAQQFQDAISEEAIEGFRKQYKGSDEEKDDLLAAYEEFEGDMDAVYETVMLSDVAEDDERFRKIIDEAIAEGKVEAYKKYTKETNKSRTARVKNSRKEAKEAEELAKKLGVHDKLKGKKGGSSKKDSEAGLAALIRANQARRGEMFDALADRYGAKPAAKDKKGKKRGFEEPDISEEAFQKSSGPIECTTLGCTITGHAMTDAGAAPPDLYPQYCFHLSPTLNKWCHFRAVDIIRLASHPGFQGQDIFFCLNHPIKWARVAGVVVAITELEGKVLYTIDDSSGATIECLLLVAPNRGSSGTANTYNYNKQNNHSKDVTTTERKLPTVDGPIDIGHVIDVRGGINEFRDQKQIRAETIKHLRTTEQEALWWEKAANLRRDVLSRPWVLDPEEVEELRREEEGLSRRHRRTGLERENRPAKPQRRVTGLERANHRRACAEIEKNTSFSSQNSQDGQEDGNGSEKVSGKHRQWDIGRPENKIMVRGRTRDETLFSNSTTPLTSAPSSPEDNAPSATPTSGDSSSASPSETSQNSDPTITSTATATATASGSSTTGSGDVVTSVGPSGTVQIPKQSDTPETGSVITDLPTSGHPTDQPLLTETIPTATSLISATVAPTSDTGPAPSETVSMVAPGIFQKPISTNPPPDSIGRKSDHPAPRLGVASQGPVQTNKFYGNFMLGNQTSATYLHPYSVMWARGRGSTGSYGLAISHIEDSQKVYGQTDPKSGAASYFINPVGIHSLALSAKELGPNTALTTEHPADMSVQVSLRPGAQDAPAVQFPLVQGQGFLTAVYNGATPMIHTGVYFKTVTKSSKEAKEGVTKYKLHLEDGSLWLVYAYHTKGNALDLQVINNGYAQSTGSFYGIIQVAKDSDGGEKLYDQACGVYPTGVGLSGNVNGKTGSYTFHFKKAGHYDSSLVMWALPHHVASFDGTTKGRLSNVKLQTTTKGVATLVVGDQWTMVESDLPVNIGFAPWSPEAGSITSLSSQAKSFIQEIALQEVSQNIMQQTDQDSMYFSGKALAKFATIIMALHDMLGQESLALTALNELKSAFARFAENKQKYPLVYESGWGGVVSSASYVTGDPGVDFGNSYYNDHHFHYGYFIYTAAVIGHLDPSWIPQNKEYVNLLVRDVANPSTEDKYFPTWRNFDWYHGHSWAHGLFDTSDGKDQESSSEDTMHAYALKMWGTVSGDTDLAARGNLILAVQKRSLNSYYLYKSDNKIQPAKFIGNKAAGILFENKIDHTTYFGTNIEYIQGIHMLPLLPHTPMIRDKDFVREEWETYFSEGRAEQVSGGWKGILMGNYATIDPRGAFAFFSQQGFDAGWLDGGASLTWYLVYSAGGSFLLSLYSEDEDEDANQRHSFGWTLRKFRV